MWIGIDGFVFFWVVGVLICNWMILTHIRCLLKGALIIHFGFNGLKLNFSTRIAVTRSHVVNVKRITLNPSNVAIRFITDTALVLIIMTMRENAILNLRNPRMNSSASKRNLRWQSITFLLWNFVFFFLSIITCTWSSWSASLG